MKFVREYCRLSKCKVGASCGVLQQEQKQRTPLYVVAAQAVESLRIDTSTKKCEKLVKEPRRVRGVTIPRAMVMCDWRATSSPKGRARSALSDDTTTTPDYYR